MAARKKVVQRKKVFVVDRATWIHGGMAWSGKDGISLRVPGSGLQCCLGFVAKQCGATDRQITGKGGPEQAPRVKWPKGFLVEDEDGYFEETVAIREIMNLNDDCDKDLSDAEREKLLIGEFKKLGLVLRFTGNYPSEAT